MHRIKALIGDTQCPPLVAQGNNPEIIRSLWTELLRL
jgi:hypothetical protein